MKHILVATTAVLAIAAGAPSLAQMAPQPQAQAERLAALSAPEFVAKAALGSRFEIETSSLVEERSPRLAEMARTIVTDHEDALQQLEEIASTANLQDALNSPLDADRIMRIEALQELQGADFESEYLALQTQSHEEAIALFTAYADGGDDTALREYAATTLPTLQHHLTMVQGMMGGAPMPAVAEARPNTPAGAAPEMAAAPPLDLRQPLAPAGDMAAAGAGAAAGNAAAGNAGADNAAGNAAPADVAAAGAGAAAGNAAADNAAGNAAPADVAAAGAGAAAGNAAAGPAAGGEIVVTQPAPLVEVQQAAAQVQVSQPQPQVNVQQAAPEIIVRQAEPTIRIDIPQPNVVVDMPEPQIIVRMPEPQVAVNAPPPEIIVQQPQPTIRVEQAEPQVVLNQPAAAPVVQAPAEAAAVAVQQAEPVVRFENAQPRIEFQQVGEPQVAVNRVGQPQITIERIGAGEAQAGADVAAAGAQQPAAAGADQQQMAAGAQQQIAPGAQPNQLEAGAQQQAAVADIPQAGQAGDNLLLLDPSRLAPVADARQQTLTADQVLAMDIIGANGEVIGDIETIAQFNGQMYVIIGQGGFLGLGERQIALPLSAMMYNGENLIAPGLTDEQVAQMQEVRMGDLAEIDGNAEVAVLVQ